MLKKSLARKLFRVSARMGHSMRKNGRGEKATQREMFTSKVYLVKISNTIKIVDEEEACVWMPRARCLT